MLAMRDAQFMEQNHLDMPFTIQIISRGSIVDTEAGVDYLVEATTIRLNQTALNEWVRSEPPYWPPEDDGLSDDEYERRKAERAERREAFNRQIKDDLGIDDTRGSCAISQIVSEFFTVVTMHKIAESKPT